MTAEQERLATLLARLGPGRHATLCALGDSNTANAHFTRGAKQWPELMHRRRWARALRHPGPPSLINAGISGGFRRRELRVERDVLRHRPDLGVESLGANDAGSPRRRGIRRAA